MDRLCGRGQHLDLMTQIRIHVNTCARSPRWRSRVGEISIYERVAYFHHRNQV